MAPTVHPVLRNPLNPDHVRDRQRIDAALEAVLEVLEKAPTLPAEVAHILVLRTTAELKYQLHGGTKCQLCRSHVRHALYVTSHYADNLTRTFRALCTRCMVAEEALAKRVALSFWPPEEAEEVRAA